MSITIPHNYQPRPYQIPVLQSLDLGKKRIFWIIHRRGGKDFTLWNAFIKRAVEKVGLHFYLLPTYNQAKRIIWDGITNDSLKFIDCVPRELIKNISASELKIELINGSIMQLIGTDFYDRIRGTNPITCVFSEYAYQNPMAWEVIKPILTLNGGVAIFNTTPNGYNHAHDLWEMAKKSPDWYTEMLTVRDTNLLTEADIQRERDEGMSEEMIQQEYYCSFEAGVVGAYYSDQIRMLREKQRICRGIYTKDLPVYTAWDIGFKDDTAIVFYQLFGKEVRIVDAYSNSGETIEHYISVINSKPYKYHTHYLPHDSVINSLQTGRSTYSVFKQYNLPVSVSPKLEIQEGIQQARKVLERCWFEEDATKELVHSLANYKREYDEIKKAFKKNPEHSWASHYADAFRYMAVSLPANLEKPKPTSYGFKPVTVSGMRRY